MIFQRALRKELAHTAGAVFTTLFTIVLTITLIRVLGRAADNKIGSEDVVALIGFAALNYLPVILILTLFIAVLYTVGRYYRDSEAIVWFCAGLSLLDWIKPVTWFGLPLIVLTALLSLIVTPWANQQSVAFQERFTQREDVLRITPGRFIESGAAERVFFVEALGENNGSFENINFAGVKNIFISSIQNGVLDLILAQHAKPYTDPQGNRFILLENGRRYEFGAQPVALSAAHSPTTQSPLGANHSNTKSDIQLLEFKRYGILTGHAKQAVGINSARTLPTPELWQLNTSESWGELLWRISLPISAICLMLFAIPLSAVHPRVGRSANLIVALLLFFTYSNLISFSQAMVIQGATSFNRAWWPVHALVLFCIAGLFSWHLMRNSLYHPAALALQVKHRLQSLFQTVMQKNR